MTDSSFTVPLHKRNRLVGMYDYCEPSDVHSGGQFVQIAETEANASKDVLYPELPEAGCVVGTYPQPSGGLISRCDRRAPQMVADF